MGSLGVTKAKKYLILFFKTFSQIFFSFSTFFSMGKAGPFSEYDKKKNKTEHIYLDETLENLKKESEVDEHKISLEELYR